jgi:hypothetical protein
LLPPAGRDNNADRRSPEQDTDEIRQCTSRDTHRPPPRPLTASHEYAQSLTRNSGAGAVSSFATSTSITWPCVRSARGAGGRSPSTILDIQPPQKLGSDRQSAQALGHHGLHHDTHARAFRPPGRHSGPSTRRSSNHAVGCGDCGSGKGGRARPGTSATAANPKAPTPALPTQGGANLEDRQRPPGFLPLRSEQAVLRPPRDLAGRAQPARESDPRSDRTGRWSVAPTALDPLPPRTPRPTRTGPGG